MHSSYNQEANPELVILWTKRQRVVYVNNTLEGNGLCLELQVCALFERVINAEGSDVDLDQVAAAAMEAVESAVKDEVEAAAVVSATQAALANTLRDLSAISGAPLQSEEDVVAEVAASLASIDVAASGAEVGQTARAADAIQLLDSLTSSGASSGNGAPPILQVVDGTAAASSSNTAGTSSSGPPAAGAAASSPAAAAVTALPAAAAAAAAVRPQPSAAADQAKTAKAAANKARLLQLCAFSVAAALGWAFLQSTAGQALVVSVQGIGASIAERIGPIHIGEAERGLLETIWLLLTSIVCVPAVCKLIPGGSPVLGYLVRSHCHLLTWRDNAICHAACHADLAGQCHMMSL
jgi:hypothetical protein